MFEYLWWGFAFLMSCTMILFPAAWKELFVATGTFAFMRRFYQERGLLFYRIQGIFVLCILLLALGSMHSTPTTAPTKPVSSHLSHSTTGTMPH